MIACADFDSNNFIKDDVAILNIVNSDKNSFFLFNFDLVRIIGKRCITKLYFLLISASISLAQS